MDKIVNIPPKYIKDGTGVMLEITWIKLIEKCNILRNQEFFPK
jgi:hypothetical protein